MTANKTKWVRLGDYIEEVDERNTEGKYSVEDVRGISTDKTFIATKANMDGVSVLTYKVASPRLFAYVADTSRRGDKIALALNTSSQTYLISSIYSTFRAVGELLPEYLYMLLRRGEFDRYARFNSWGSARETFSWEEMCRVRIPLPSMEVQRELVATYEGLKRLAEDNESLIAPLTEACQAFIVDCKRQYPSVPLGDYIEEIREINSDCEIKLEQGININKEFIQPQRLNSDLSSRVIVRKGQFAYCTQLNNENVALSYREGDDCVVSPVYRVFSIKPNFSELLLPKYLFIILQRREFGRYVYWRSTGSAYEFLQEESIRSYRIPLPPLEVQQSIVNLYHCIEEAKSIAREARERLTTLCPALVQYAINA